MNNHQELTPSSHRMRKLRLNAERLERWRNYQFDLKARREWTHPADSIDGVEPEQVLARFAREWLTPVFLFLAEGNKASGKTKTGTLDKRAWALLYAVRPDLLNGESMADVSRRWGIDEAAVNYYVRQFERYVPGFRALGGGTKKRSTAVREAVGRATFERSQRRSVSAGKLDE